MCSICVHMSVRFRPRHFDASRRRIKSDTCNARVERTFNPVKRSRPREIPQRLSAMGGDVSRTFIVSGERDSDTYSFSLASNILNTQQLIARSRLLQTHLSRHTHTTHILSDSSSAKTDTDCCWRGNEGVHCPLSVSSLKRLDPWRSGGRQTNTAQSPRRAKKKFARSRRRQNIRR